MTPDFVFSVVDYVCRVFSFSVPKVLIKKKAWVEMVHDSSFELWLIALFGNLEKKLDVNKKRLNPVLTPYDGK